MIMDLAIGQSIDVEKLSVRKWTMAIRAYKTIWMPLNSESCDIISCYGKITAGTFVCEQLKKVILAIWLSIFLMEAIVGIELTTAMSANKVFGVKCLIQCNGYFLLGGNRLIGN